MELGIKAREIMKQDFPILDSSFNLEKCVEKMSEEEACVVLHEGFLYSVLSYDEILKALVDRKENLKLENIKPSKNFIIVRGDTDLLDVINLMKRKSIDFIIVKDENCFGIITKREITEVNQFLFDILEKENEVLV